MISGELGQILEYFPKFVCEMAHALTLDGNALPTFMAAQWHKKAKKLASAGSSVARAYLQSALNDARYPNDFRRAAKMILEQEPIEGKPQKWHDDYDRLSKELRLLHYCYNWNLGQAPHASQVCYDTAKAILDDLSDTLVNAAQKPEKYEK